MFVVVIVNRERLMLMINVVILLCFSTVPTCGISVLKKIILSTVNVRPESA